MVAAVDQFESWLLMEPTVEGRLELLLVDPLRVV